MIGDRLEKGYRTGQIKGKDFLYITGPMGYGGSLGGQVASFRYLWWAIPAHHLAVLNTKLEILNESFELYDRYAQSPYDTPIKQPYRVLISSKQPAGDVVDYSAIKGNFYVEANTGIGRSWSINEALLPQPTDTNYDGKIYVIIDMLAVGKAPEDADFGILSNQQNYEAMRTKVYDYEARL